MFPVRSELRPVVELFCRLDGCHIAKLTAQTMMSTVKLAIDNHGSTDSWRNHDTGVPISGRQQLTQSTQLASTLNGQGAYDEQAPHARKTMDIRCTDPLNHPRFLDRRLSWDTP